MALCNIEIKGNLGRDPELRYTPNGQAVCSFSVAVSFSKPDGAGGWKDEGTNWFNVTAWDKVGERWAEELRKGDTVIVWGRFKQREYTGAKGPGVSLDIQLTNLVVVGAKADRANAGARPAAAPAASAAPNDDPMDDLPF